MTFFQRVLSRSARSMGCTSRMLDTKHISVPGVRYASQTHYNLDIAGLTEEQVEVRHEVTGVLPTDAQTMYIQFRNAVEEFAEREVAPRAAEIDKSNTFPMVCTLLLFVLVQQGDSDSSGSLGEVRKHGSIGCHRFAGLWWARVGILRAYTCDGSTFSCIWKRCIVVWCAFKFVCQPGTSVHPL